MVDHVLHAGVELEDEQHLLRERVDHVGQRRALDPQRHVGRRAAAARPRGAPTPRAGACPRAAARGSGAGCWRSRSPVRVGRRSGRGPRRAAGRAPSRPAPRRRARRPRRRRAARPGRSRRAARLDLARQLEGPRLAAHVEELEQVGERDLREVALDAALDSAPAFGAPRAPARSGEQRPHGARDLVGVDRRGDQAPGKVPARGRLGALAHEEQPRRLRARVRAQDRGELGAVDQRADRAGPPAPRGARRARSRARRRRGSSPGRRARCARQASAMRCARFWSPSAISTCVLTPGCSSASGSWLGTARSCWRRKARCSTRLRSLVWKKRVFAGAVLGIPHQGVGRSVAVVDHEGREIGESARARASSRPARRSAAARHRRSPRARCGSRRRAATRAPRAPRRPARCPARRRGGRARAAGARSRTTTKRAIWAAVSGRSRRALVEQRLQALGERHALEAEAAHGAAPLLVDALVEHAQQRLEAGAVARVDGGAELRVGPRVRRRGA